MTHEPIVKQTALRMALACWCVAPDHGMSPEQHNWLTTRLTDQTPLMPQERERVRKPLLAWCVRLGGASLAAIVERQYTETITNECDHRA